MIDYSRIDMMFFATLTCMFIYYRCSKVQGRQVINNIVLVFVSSMIIYVFLLNLNIDIENFLWDG